MRFKFEETASNVHYALKMRKNENGLYWQTGMGDDTLLVCCPFGKTPFEMIPEFCEALNRSNIGYNSFSPVQFKGETYYARLVSYREKEKNKGCQIIRNASSYIVLACLTEGEDVTIYAPKSEKDQRRDVSMEVELTYADEVDISKTLFGKVKETLTGFIIVDTDKLDLGDYEDGDICYIMDGLEIPVTKQMLERPVYIKTASKPAFESRKPGLTLIVSKDA